MSQTQKKDFRNNTTNVRLRNDLYTFITEQSRYAEAISDTIARIIGFKKSSSNGDKHDKPTKRPTKTE